MKAIYEDSIADVMFHLKWNSDMASHSEFYEAKGLNMWRDWLPKEVSGRLSGMFPGEQADFSFRPGELIPDISPKETIRIKNTQFEGRSSADVQPRAGRFYPKGLLKYMPGIFSDNVEPFRCADIDNGHIQVDFNHPLAGRSLKISATVENVKEKETERGGTSNEWMSILTAGPGMQARWQASPTDFFSDNPFAREDETADSLFYTRPRFVHHLDDTAREKIRQCHGRLLRDGDRVLDLMSSWVTHVPEKFSPGRISGLGMNAEELKKNPVLHDHVVHDINKSPELPFPSESFDAVLCTVSVEYMIHPLAVFREVARVLRPRGLFIVTFSNRWFPPKAIRIWKHLYDFERMGLVQEYFLRSEAFDTLETLSIRGLPRPMTDKYFPEQLYSDPVYGVWGQKAE